MNENLELAKKILIDFQDAFYHFGVTRYGVKAQGYYNEKLAYKIKEAGYPEEISAVTKFREYKKGNIEFVLT